MTRQPTGIWATLSLFPPAVTGGLALKEEPLFWRSSVLGGWLRVILKKKKRKAIPLSCVTHAWPSEDMVMHSHCGFYHSWIINRVAIENAALFSAPLSPLAACQAQKPMDSAEARARLLADEPISMPSIKGNCNLLLSSRPNTCLQNIPHQPFSFCVKVRVCVSLLVLLSRV